MAALGLANVRNNFSLRTFFIEKSEFVNINLNGINKNGFNEDRIAASKDNKFG